MSKYFFVITGPSACGKTTLLERGVTNKFWEIAQKYSTREERMGGQFDDIKTMSKDEIYASNVLDYRYIMNDNVYAFSSGEIISKLNGKNGQPAVNVAIVCSDLGIIRKLRQDTNLKNRLVVLFISTVPTTKQVTKAWLKRQSGIAYSKNNAQHEPVPSFNKLNDFSKKLCNIVDKYYNHQIDSTQTQSFQSFSDTFQNLYEHYVELMPSSDSYKRRIRNIDKFYYKYVEEIAFFDYTILNFFDPADEGNLQNEKMTEQVKNIIKHIDFNTNAAPSLRKFGDNALFFICAPKRAGKAILFSNLNLMSRDSIEIVRKIALREDKNTEAELKKGKGDGFGLSETYWMFDSKEEETFKNLENAKYAAGEESAWDGNENLTTVVDVLLSKASERVNDLIVKKAPPGFVKQEYNFKEWYWHFQGNYYAVDTNSILNAKKHNIVISNMDQLDAAKEWAKKAGKIFVPIFLVFVDYEESSKNFHTLQNTSNGEKINTQIFKTIDNYYSKVGEFRHVILNNGIAEDVHDQISNIISQYK